jgi:hypothetical protein
LDREGEARVRALIQDELSKQNYEREKEPSAPQEDRKLLNKQPTIVSDPGYTSTQPMTQNVLRISDSIVAPRPFTGRPGEGDPEEWLIFFKRYAEHKGWNDLQTKQAIELMMRGPAQNWLIGLNETQSASLESLIEAFKESFMESPELKWKGAQDMFTRPQKMDETVNQYVIRLRKLARSINADEETIKHALVAGLRAPIRMQVLLRGTSTFEKVLETARLAEGSNSSADPITALLHEQIRSSTKAAEKQSDQMRELASRVDKLAVAMTATDSYGINVVGDSSTAEQRLQTSLDSRDDQPRGNYVPGRQLKNTPQNRQRALYGQQQGELQERARVDPARQQTAWSNSNRMQPQQQRRWPPITQTDHHQMQPRDNCPNCGLNHGREATCWARGQSCRNCGKPNHYARCCRASRRPLQH